jgi:hypothetical protein
MKKVILCAMIALAFTTGNAQIKTEAGTFNKPGKGTIIMEASLSPNVVGGGVFSLPSLNNDLGVVGIKVRDFVENDKAYRFGANVSVLDSGEEGADTQFTLALSAGLEHHMAGAERLSTYWGYEANVGVVQGSEEVDGYDDYYGDYTDTVKTTKLGVGANVFTGFDYYIMPKIYLGAEVSYGLAITNTKPDGGDSVTKVQLAPSITPSFRLGWQF